jgi:ADP-ribose pyrophosphatase YjhB (NUDIX family)
MPAVLQPNAAIVANLRRKPVGDEDLASAKGHAAGTLYVAPDGAVLLLRRSPKEENFAGHWSLPGGGVEDGETPEDGARREAMEEMGPDIPQGKRKLIDQKVTPTGMLFHTFAQPVDEKFTPKLNDEHDGFLWVSLIDLLKYLSEEPDAK